MLFKVRNFHCLVSVSVILLLVAVVIVSMLGDCGLIIRIEVLCPFVADAERIFFSVTLLS